MWVYWGPLFSFFKAWVAPKESLTQSTCQVEGFHTLTDTGSVVTRCCSLPCMDF